MKLKFAAVLVISMLVAGLVVGCGGGDTATKNDSGNTTQSAAQSAEKKSDNPLMNAEVKTMKLKSGECAYINVTTNMDGITTEQLAELFNAKIKDCGKNYFTVCFNDKSGIAFPACKPFGSHGELDSTKGVGDGKMLGDVYPKYASDGNTVADFEYEKR